MKRRTTDGRSKKVNVPWKATTSRRYFVEYVAPVTSLREPVQVRAGSAAHPDHQGG